jgi:1-phosphofructokinase
VQTVDPRGAGDSMTAGIAAALCRGEDLLSAARLGAAAGGLNVTRRGLATGSRPEIERLMEHVQIEPAEEAER